MDATFRATLMAADTGESRSFGFTADSGLFHQSANQIVQAFMECMKAEHDWAREPSYKLDAASKQADDRLVVATGSLLYEKGERPFLLMICPNTRTLLATGERP